MASAQQPRKGRDAGVAVLDDLKASSHSLAPRHFEFWFNYRTGKHPPLNAAADEIVAARGKLADRDIDQLYDRFLSPWRFGEDCNALTRRFADRLEDVSSALDEAIGSSLAQREILIAESCDLSLGGTVTLQRVIEAVDRLMQSTKDGQMRHAILEARLEAASRQIGALRRQLDAVRGESRSDPLTSLENRTAFEAALDRAATHAARTDEALSVVLVDVDYFASINENFGRAIADQVLRSIGLLLKTHMRPTDLVARVAEDEFAVILRAPIAETVRLAERFRQTLMTTELVKVANGGAPGRVTASAGAAGFLPRDTADKLIERATAGLKVAKTEGRNRIVEMQPDGPVWTAARIT